MNRLLLGIFFFFLILLETTIINLPLTESLIAIVSLRRRPPETFFWTFGTGILFDLFSQQTLGQKSMVFLIISLAAGFFSRHIGFLGEPVFGRRKIILGKTS